MPTSKEPDASAARDEAAVHALVRQNLPLVEIVARQVAKDLRGALRMDELVSFGNEGLLTAARSFDATYGVPFHRWASIRVRGAILDGLRSMGSLPRRLYRLLRAIEAGNEVAEALTEENASAPPAGAEAADERLGSYLSSLATAMAMGLLATPSGSGDLVDPSPTAEEQLEREELLTRIRASVAKRPDAERHLLERHYFGGVTLEEAAAEIGLSKSWASRLHARAVEAVMRDLKRDRIV